MKHEFALFISELNQLQVSKQHLVVSEKTVMHRIQHVLRLTLGDRIVLFDEHEHVSCSINEITKKHICFDVGSWAKNIRLEPEVYWLLPLLERESFEDALYALAALGATSITPVITEKSRKKWGSAKEYERAHRIMVAAAEQSKNFLLPKIKKTKTLTEALMVGDSAAIFFDVGGASALEVMQNLNNRMPSSLFCLVGPEGDLTEHEKTLVLQHKFVDCKLTPTVLKASHAVMVGLGMVRSCLRRA